MFKKLIKQELVSLKRQNFKDKYHVQRLQQMLDEDFNFDRWQSTGQMMPKSEYLKTYGKDMVGKNCANDVFRYAGGLAIELTDAGLYYCKELNRIHPDIVQIEVELYSHFKSKENEVSNI